MIDGGFSIIPELLEAAEKPPRPDVKTLALASAVAPVIRTNAARASSKKVKVLLKAGGVEESTLARVQEGLLKRAGIEMEVTPELAAEAERKRAQLAATACVLCGATSETRAPFRFVPVSKNPNSKSAFGKAVPFRKAKFTALPREERNHAFKFESRFEAGPWLVDGFSFDAHAIARLLGVELDPLMPPESRWCGECGLNYTTSGRWFCGNGCSAKFRARTGAPHAAL